MSTDGRKDRLWIAGGCLVALVLALAGYFVLIGPQRTTTAERDTQAADARAEIPVLKKKLADLRKDNERLPEYKDDLERLKAALPETVGVPEYLRLMQDMGARTGVAVDNVTLGSPTLIQEPAGVYSIPVTLLIAGSAAQIDVFLAVLQQVQPRAVLVTNLDLAPTESDTDLSSGEVTATLTTQFYVTGEAPVTRPAPTPGTAAKGTD
jgi:Tfp pilus assembly protein PilO